MLSNKDSESVKYFWSMSATFQTANDSFSIKKSLVG